MDLRLLSPPITREQKLAVVTLEEAKAQAAIDHGYHDDLIKDKIVAAYNYVSGPNGFLGRCCLLEETWEAYLPSKIANDFEIPLRPFVSASLDAFEWIQSNGAYRALNASRYHVIRSDTFAHVQRATMTPWPFYGLAHPAAYRIEFKAGFGTTKESIPEEIREAIKVLAAEWYHQRDATQDRRIREKVRYGIDSLVRAHAVYADHS